jgi:hypothetical protein
MEAQNTRLLQDIAALRQSTRQSLTKTKSDFANQFRAKSAQWDAIKQSLETREQELTQECASVRQECKALAETGESMKYDLDECSERLEACEREKLDIVRNKNAEIQALEDRLRVHQETIRAHGYDRPNPRALQDAEIEAIVRDKEKFLENYYQKLMQDYEQKCDKVVREEMAKCGEARQKSEKLVAWYRTENERLSYEIPLKFDKQGNIIPPRQPPKD